MSQPSDATESVVIVGSGPAGLTAAIYAARASLNPLMLAGFNAGGLIPGGQLMFTTDVENYPGFPDGVTGPEMMDAFRRQAERFGTRIHNEDVSEIDLSRRPFRIKTDEREVFARTVIISTGARANWLNLPKEDQLRLGGGVSACAVCDGGLAVFRNQPLVVVGGGDSAVEEATYLTKFASRVYMVHRRGELRASKAMQQRALENDKLEIVWHSRVAAYLTEQNNGREVVSGVTLEDLRDQTTRNLPCRGVFMGIGHTPNTELFRGQLDLDDAGYIKTRPGSTYTSVEGVFAAGDVQDHVYRQAVTAAGSGCMAALDCERWLAAAGHH